MSLLLLFIFFYVYFPKNKRTRHIKKGKFFAPLSFKKADGVRGGAPK